MVFTGSRSPVVCRYKYGAKGETSLVTRKDQCKTLPTIFSVRKIKNRYGEKWIFKYFQGCDKDDG